MGQNNLDCPLVAKSTLENKILGMTYVLIWKKKNLDDFICWRF